VSRPRFFAGSNDERDTGLTGIEDGISFRHFEGKRKKRGENTKKKPSIENGMQYGQSNQFYASNDYTCLIMS
jgi:hypothetical protein